MGLLLWLVAMVYSFLRPNLWVLDWVALTAAWILFLLGVALIVVGLIRTRSLVTTVAVGLVVVVVSATIGSWWQLSPRGWFFVNRPMFNAALATDPGSEYYGARLPVPLRYLSIEGRVSGGYGEQRDTRFFAQWMGVPDDAGGYLHSPSGSPEGFDMYGMMCRNPVSLGGDWWMCGMRD
ncbi:hypothetical protein HUN08_04940 [Gordonia sp. X0973]|uniref:hypothetical protein n=1 Tax=Gordonia sp. X0973 TaxID=2742602 RepID=UPI000F5448FC|nr:hypothetical protein [Gordonia sp. X0973]QKT06608.1 hypothetical protein HUN08_04940 [Gordonia sp. X0973]